MTEKILWKRGLLVVIIIIFIISFLGILGLISLAIYDYNKSEYNEPKLEITNKTSAFRPRVKQTVSAIFNLPADGTIIDRDSKGQRVQYKAGQYTYLKQLTKPGKYIWINKKTPSWSTSKKSCRSGPATSDGFVRLMSCSGRNMRLEITVK